MSGHNSGSLLVLLLISFFLFGCRPNSSPENAPSSFLVVLGIAQDAGFPQAQCVKSCCLEVWNQPQKHRNASCLAYIDLDLQAYWLFDVTPDFKEQTHHIESRWDVELAGAFITHAHVGHYSGLIHLGREIVGANNLPVYVMPRMRQFLETNGPWDQLVRLNNIKLLDLQANAPIRVTKNTTVTPFLVPHRDEYSETVGFEIVNERTKAIYIPDIDKWQKWERNLGDQITKVDLALIDGSFFRANELPGRDMTTIPHPLVKESIALLKNLTVEEKRRVHFTHFNHTNPLLHTESAEYKFVQEEGFRIASEGSVFPL